MQPVFPDYLSVSYDYGANQLTGFYTMAVSMFSTCLRNYNPEKK